MLTPRTARLDDAARYGSIHTLTGGGQDVSEMLSVA